MSDRQEHISLRDYFEVRIAALEKAVQVAKVEMDRRLDGMNEFREQLNTQANKFLTRTEYELLRLDVQSLKEVQAELRGKASRNSVTIAYALSAASIMVSIIIAITK